MHIICRRLKLFDFGNPGRCKSLSHRTSISFLNSAAILSDRIRILGFALDPGLIFDHHTWNVCSSSHYHIRSRRRSLLYLQSSVPGWTVPMSFSIGCLYGIFNVCSLFITRSHTSLFLHPIHQSDLTLYYTPYIGFPYVNESLRLDISVYQSLHATAPSYLSSLLCHARRTISSSQIF